MTDKQQQASAAHFAKECEACFVAFMRLAICAAPFQCTVFVGLGML